jgi:serine/threonine protein kinase
MATVMNKERLFRKGKLSIGLIALGLLSSLNAASPHASKDEYSSSYYSYSEEDGNRNAAAQKVFPSVLKKDHNPLCFPILDEAERRNVAFLRALPHFSRYEHSPSRSFPPKKDRSEDAVPPSVSSHVLPEGRNLICTLPRNENERQLLEGIFGVRMMAEENAYIASGELLGKGGYGTVFGARSDTLNQELVIKSGGPEDMTLEFDIAKISLMAVLNLLRAGTLPRSVLPGLQSLVFPFGITEDGCLVERRVHGHTVEELADITTEDGCLVERRIHRHTVGGLANEGLPVDLRRALLLALDFYRALAIFHRLGLVSRDLNSRNVMVEIATDGQGRTKYTIYLIDFGLSTPTIETILKQLTILNDEIARHRELHPDESCDAQLQYLCEQKAELEAKKDDIQRRLDNFLQLNGKPLTSSFDIPDSVFILELLLSRARAREEALATQDKQVGRYQSLVFPIIDALKLKVHSPGECPSAEIIAQILQILAHAPEMLLQAMVNDDSLENRILETVRMLQGELIPPDHPMLVPVFASDDPNEQPSARDVAMALLAAGGDSRAQALMLKMSQSSHGKYCATKSIADVLLFMISLFPQE